MRKRCTILILLIFFTLSATPAWAEDMPPAQMSDEALASYISGRLKAILADEDYRVSRVCDASGCSVVVQ